MNINSIKSLPIVDKKKKFVDYTLPSQMKVIQKSQLLFLWQVERGKGYFL